MTQKSNKKNVLIVNGYLNIGGAERVLTLLANHLCKTYNVFFATLQKSEKTLFALEPKVKLLELNLETNRLSIKRMGFIKSIQYYHNVSTALKNIVDKYNIDLLIAFNDREVFLTWLSLHRNKQLKFVFSQRNAPSSKPLRNNILLKYIYHHCDLVVFQLEKVRKFYKFNKYDTRAIVIENPVNIYPAKPVLQRKKIIIGAGRLVPQKRFDLLIRSFEVFLRSHPTYRLEIFGRGPLKDELNALIDSHGLSKNVCIKDAIPNVMQKKYDCNMFVLSSDFEGIPNVLIEAMAAGIPCISTDCDPGGGALVTNNGNCGLLVPCGDIPALSNAMCRLADEPELASQMAVAASKYIMRFSEKNIYDLWEKAIAKILN